LDDKSKTTSGNSGGFGPIKKGTHPAGQDVFLTTGIIQNKMKGLL